MIKKKIFSPRNYRVRGQDSHQWFVCLFCFFSTNFWFCVSLGAKDFVRLGDLLITPFHPVHLQKQKTKTKSKEGFDFPVFFYFIGRRSIRTGDGLFRVSTARHS